MSIIPTVPAAWLTFADGVVYPTYDDGFELWGVSVRSDQQTAGLIMKLLGGFYIWGIIVVKFFSFTREQNRQDQRLRPAAGRLADGRPASVDPPQVPESVE
jgi:putative membrane protein